jgi:hypothetical protein
MTSLLIFACSLIDSKELNQKDFSFKNSIFKLLYFYFIAINLYYYSASYLMFSTWLNGSSLLRKTHSQFPLRLSKSALGVG